MLHNIKFKQGAASFYIVAIATLILVIMATSFAAIIMSEIARTSNDDLAQSAYDSALAGIEDAKLAYYKYNQCVADRGEDECASQLESLTKDCDGVARLLGRDQEEDGSVKIQESASGDSNMDQAYTCVKFDLPTYYTNVMSGDGSTKTTQVVPISTVDGQDVNDIESIQVSWGKAEASSSDLPPILEFGIIQASRDFTLDNFTKTYDDQTNRGTLFLEPTTDTGNYSVTKSIPASELLKSNDKTAYNHTQQVFCDIAAASEGANGGFLCSVNIKLPTPVGRYRDEDSFVVILSMLAADDVPYTFALCKEGGCEIEKEGDIEDNTVHMDMQIAVDSTGRANDLYRRVYTTLESSELSSIKNTTTTTSGSGHANPYYALSAQEIQKIYYSTCETHFGSNGAGCED